MVSDGYIREAHENNSAGCPKCGLVTRRTVPALSNSLLGHRPAVFLGHSRFRIATQLRSLSPPRIQVKKERLSGYCLNRSGQRLMPHPSEYAALPLA